MDRPDPGIELGSPALQVDSLPAELSGKPICSSSGFIFLAVQDSVIGLDHSLCFPVD